MKHSVQAYLERIPTEQLTSFLENDSFEEIYGIDTAILQDILEVLISRNTVEGGRLSVYIHKIQALQKKGQLMRNISPRRPGRRRGDEHIGAENDSLDQFRRKRFLRK